MRKPCPSATLSTTNLAYTHLALIYVRFLVNKVAVGQVFLPVLRLSAVSTVPIIFHSRIRLHVHLFSPHGSTGPQQVRASSISWLHDHTQTHHTRQDSSGRVLIPMRRPLPDDTQYSLETEIYVTGGIRTRDPSKRAAADPCQQQGKEN